MLQELPWEVRNEILFILNAKLQIQYFRTEWKIGKDYIEAESETELSKENIRCLQLQVASAKQKRLKGSDIRQMGC